MANTVISPNMSLPVPIVGEDPGPQWATDIDSCLTVIDNHNHSSGSGVQINPAGININTDLPFYNNSATQLKATKFTSQTAPLSGASNPTSLYAATTSGNLYFNDTAGNQIQITSAGAVAGTPGSISGLIAPASASYNSGSGTFVFQSAASTPGNIDGASITIREKVLSPNGITLSSPISLAANYTLTLPTALPAGVRILTVDNSGNMGDSYDVDNVTLQVTSSLLNIKALPANVVTTTSIVANAVTRPKLVAVGQQIVNSGGLFATSSTSPVDVLSLSLTTTGRPVMITTQGTVGTTCNFSGAYGVIGSIFFQVVNSTTGITIFNTQYSQAAITTAIPFPGFAMLYPEAAGSYTYKIQLYVSSASITASLTNVSLAAYEL